VQVIEENPGEEELEIAVIESAKYRICEYDGNEWIETPESIDWVQL